MIYFLVGAAIFALMVWAGRRARPLLLKREMKILSASIGLMAMIAGGFLALRGGYMLGGVLGAIGMGLVFSGRNGVLAPPASPEDATLKEAREILGVGIDATREEIKAAYGRLIRSVHPDAGGTAGLAARLNAARDALLKK
jgi:hypothetical protein